MVSDLNQKVSRKYSVSSHSRLLHLLHFIVCGAALLGVERTARAVMSLDTIIITVVLYSVSFIVHRSGLGTVPQAKYGLDTYSL